MSDTIDTPEYILKMAIALGERDYTFVGNLAYEALGRYAKLLERSAGVWVPVREKPPTTTGMYWCLVANGTQDEFWYGGTHLQWDYSGYGITHWLDAKLPGGK